MANNGGHKIKLLKIYEILKNNTDEQHRLTTQELIERLKKEGITCDRKILYEDIDILNQHGFEVCSIRSRQMEYYVVDRNFDEAELRILMDAVQAANFITPKKTKELTNKIAQLAGSHRGLLLQRNIKCVNEKKSNNEFIYYNVNEISNAIEEKKKISFKYFDLNLDGTKDYRKDGACYIENPIDLVIYDDKYYLIVYNEKHDSTIPYRVDKMENVLVLNEDSIQKGVKEANRIRNEAFSMYTGELMPLKLIFDKSIVGQVIDNFGHDLYYERVDDNTFQAVVHVYVSPTFYSWCFNYGDKIKLIAPEKVINEYKKYLNEALSQIN